MKKLKKMMRSSHKGYTLIEAIIAVAIFSMMMVILNLFFVQQMNEFKKISDKGFDVWNNAKFIWFNKLVSSAHDYYVYSKVRGWGPYFIGRDDYFSFVSLSPIAKDNPVLVWIVKEKSQGGGVDLVVYEREVKTETLYDIENIFLSGEYKQGARYVILENCDDLVFEYFGMYADDKKKRWFRDFDGLKAKLLPEVIKIVYFENREKRELYQQILNNSTLKGYYEEIYMYD